MGSKANEWACLNDAINIAIGQRGATKRLAKCIKAGIDRTSLNEQNEERPDFILHCPSLENQKETLVGIEHFRVDHLVTEKKYGGVASTGVVEQKNVDNLYKNHHEKVLASDTIPDDTLNDVVKILQEQISNKMSATYANYMASFRHCLEKHAKSIPEYYRKLRKISNGRYDVKFGFLIEIHSDFSELYLTRKGQTKKIQNGLAPMFMDVVDLLEKRIDGKKVNFIILYFRETLKTNKQEVIFLDAKDCRKSLSKQNIPVFEYAGEDCFLKPFENPYADNNSRVDYERTDDNSVEFGVTASVWPRDDYIYHLCASCKKAMEYDKTGQPYTITRGTLFMKEVLGKYIIGWHKVGQNEWNILPYLKSYDIRTIEREISVFDSKWGEKNGVR